MQAQQETATWPNLGLTRVPENGTAVQAQQESATCPPPGQLGGWRPRISGRHVARGSNLCHSYARLPRTHLEAASLASVRPAL